NKIFLKTGALAVLESIREEKIKQFCLQIKPLIQTRLVLMKHLRADVELQSIERLKRNVGYFLQLRNNSWWRLFLTLKPLLDVTRNENKMKEKENEVNILSKQLKDNENELLELKNQLKEMLIQYENVGLQIKEGTKKNSLLEEKLENLTQLNNQKTHEKIQLTDQLRDLSNKLKTNEANLKELECFMSKEKEANKIKDKELNDMQEKIEKLKYDLEREKETSKQLNQQVDMANLKLETNKAESKGELQNLLITKQAELSEKQQEIEKFLSENKALKKEVTENKEKVEGLEVEKKSILCEMDQILNKLKTTENTLKLKEEKNKILENEESALKQKVYEIERENKTLESQTEDLSYNLLSAEKQISSLKAENNNKNSEISKLMSELENERSNTHILNMKIQEEIEIRNKELQNQRKEYEKTSDVARKLAIAEKKLIQTHKQLEISHADYNNLLTEQRKNDENWFVKLKQFNEEKQAELKKLKNKITDLTFQIQKQEREIVELKEINAEPDSSMLEEYNDIISKEKATSKELRCKLNEAEQKVILLEGMKSNVDESKLSIFYKTVNQLDADLTNFYNSAKNIIFNEFGLIKSLNEQLTIEITTKLRKIHVLEKTIANKEIEIAMEKAKMEAYLVDNENRESFKTELNKLKASLLEYKMFDKQTLLEKQAHLLEIESLKNIIENYKTRVKGLNTQVCELITEKENVRRQVSIDAQVNIIDSCKTGSEEQSGLIESLNKRVKELESLLLEKINEIEIYELKDKSRIKINSKDFKQLMRQTGGYKIGESNVGISESQNESENMSNMKEIELFD
ncbi:Myosin-11, partial [Cucumispora dikerogammari]